MSVSFYLDGEADDLPELNVANANARALLRMLGLEAEGDLVGSIDPEDLLFRISMADPTSAQRPMTDNHGVHIAEDAVRQVPRMIDCGLQEDQVRRYLQILTFLAETAKERGPKPCTKTVTKILWA